jgi:Flp pilus assembly protein TadD
MIERIAICRSEQAYRQARRSYALLEEGTAAMRRDEVDLAYKAFMDAAECDPTNYVALNNLGSLILNERKEGRKALKWFQAAARFWNSPVVENNLKQARMALKKGAD